MKVESSRAENPHEPAYFVASNFLHSCFSLSRYGGKKAIGYVRIAQHFGFVMRRPVHCLPRLPAETKSCTAVLCECRMFDEFGFEAVEISVHLAPCDCRLKQPQFRIAGIAASC